MLKWRESLELESADFDRSAHHSIYPLDAVLLIQVVRPLFGKFSPRFAKRDSLLSPSAACVSFSKFLFLRVFTLSLYVICFLVSSRALFKCQYWMNESLWSYNGRSCFFLVRLIRGSLFITFYTHRRHRNCSE